MTNFVLVHGAWAGDWTMERTAADLRAAGHRALVVALAGLGSRRDELNPAIDLSRHIDDVIDQVARAGFDRFVLVGHSYGGMVITGTAARMGARIDALVYVDAFIPEDGQSLWDITGEFEHDWYISSQKETPGLVAPIGGAAMLETPGVGRHPLLTLIEAVKLRGAEAKVPRREYVYATGWQPTPFTRFRDAVCGDPAWTLHEWDAGHDLMNDQPEKLLALLLDCAD